MTEKWTIADIPSQVGKTAVVTGANTGIGYETARLLAERGAAVIMACRNLDKGKQAQSRLATAAPDARIELVHIDTSDLGSVRSAGAEIAHLADRLDLLVNNAGTAWPPYSVTAEGVELQFAANYLGHFALTGLLLDNLAAAPAARVISLSSHAHRAGRIRFDDLAFAGGYQPLRAYAQSKLAVLMFTYELQRRLEAAHSSISALAAHPGGSRTELLRNPIGPAPKLTTPAVMRRLGQFQSAEMGALCTLRAAVDPRARGGQYYGPDGLFEVCGHPAVVKSSKRSHDKNLQRRLWYAAEHLSAVTYAL
jgi:NAD(P)-dependent dehydrogenase (short-subunit alcohol dehydrogenase family)